MSTTVPNFAAASGHVPDHSLRGRCEPMAREAVAADPGLELVRGWYHDPVWGRQEHWWARRPDGVGGGEIIDPSAAQFPVPGVAALYEEYRGVLSCEQCGAEIAEADVEWAGGFPVCNGTCYGRLVGLL